MENKIIKQRIILVLRSLVIVVVSFMMFAGSCGSFEEEADMFLGTTEDKGDGVKETTYQTPLGEEKIMTRRDDEKKPHGDYIWTFAPKLSSGYAQTESGRMVHGKRDGMWKYTGKEGVNWVCYDMGEVIDCDEKSLSETPEGSAMNYLESENYWYLFRLNAYGFNNDTVKAYLDTIEAELASYTFTEEEFYDYYDQVVEGLEETPFDSLTQHNGNNALRSLLEKSLDSEFRLAVLDRYTGFGDDLYEVFEIRYPNYLRYMNRNDITNEQYKAWCGEFESRMAEYPEVSSDDPFFIDSLDWRMSMVVIEIGEEYYVEEKSFRSLIENYSVLKNTFQQKSVGEAYYSDISSLIIISLYNNIYEIEVFSKCVFEAWKLKQGIASKPTVITSLDEETANMIIGNVFEDGGADVTNRGIVWAETYNPTLSANVEASGTGVGTFSITLEGLTAGSTYFARSYAINSVDTAYGNCVEFVAGAIEDPGSTTSIHKQQDKTGIVIVCPNPANTQITIQLNLESSNEIQGSLFNLQGQLIQSLRLESNSLSNSYSIDVSSIPEGTYVLYLNNGETIISEKVVVSR